MRARSNFADAFVALAGVVYKSNAQPTAPTLISPRSTSSPGPTIAGLTPTMSWNAATGATGYGLYVSDTATGTLVYDNDYVASVTSLALPSGVLSAGRAYRWNMRAKNAAGWSATFSSHLYFQTQDTNPPTHFYLRFPLLGHTYASAVINSVFDHSMSSSYVKDDVVIAYTGERGDKRFCWDGSAGAPGLMNEDGTHFVVNGHYAGAGTPQYLNYDGHPGIDFRAPSGTPLYATADGVVRYPSSIPGLSNASAYHTLAIDHGNGYTTYFLHCSSHPLSGNAVVAEGTSVHRETLVAYSGDAGTPGVPHLHFEVHYREIPVDPYGWNGAGADPYTRATSINLWAPEIGEPASLGVVWIPSPNFENRLGGQAPDTVVIHTTQGDYETALSKLTNNSVPLKERVSAHYIIKANGDIVQLVDLSKRAWHATYYNDRSIGIEMVGFAEQQATWNTENLAALEALVAYLAQRYGISVSHPLGNACSYTDTWFTPSGIVGHEQIQPSPCYPKTYNGDTYYAKSDPGRYFNWPSFIQSVLGSRPGIG